MQKSDAQQLQTILQAVEQIMIGLIRLNGDLESIYLDILSNYVRRED